MKKARIAVLLFTAMMFISSVCFAWLGGADYVLIKSPADDATVGTPFAITGRVVNSVGMDNYVVQKWQIGSSVAWANIATVSSWATPAIGADNEGALLCSWAVTTSANFTSGQSYYIRILAKNLNADYNADLTVLGSAPGFSENGDGVTWTDDAVTKVIIFGPSP